MSWRVTVAIGNPGDVLAWDITDTDPAAYGPTDGLSIIDSVPEDKLWPAHPEPSTAQLGLVLAEPSPVVVTGAPVSVNLYTPHDAATPKVTFDGRVSDLDLSPHTLGVLYRLTLTDYLADLAAWPVWTEGWPLDAPLGSELVQRVMDDAYLVAPEDYPLDVAWDANLSLVEDVYWTPRDAGSPVPALTALLDTLDLAVMGDMVTPDTSASEGPFTPNLWPDAWGRYVLRPVLSGTGVATPRVLTGWRATYVRATVPDTELPATLVLSGGVWEVQVPAPSDPASYTLDAALVDHATTWTNARSLPNTILATAYGLWQRPPKGFPPPTAPAEIAVRWSTDDGTPERAVTLDTNALGGRSAYLVAEFYLPRHGAQPWEIGDLLWYYSREAAGRLIPAVGTLVTLANINPDWSPLGPGRDWYPGLVRSRTVTVAEDEITVRLALTPFGHRVREGQGFTWADFDAAADWADLSPVDTWADYALLEG